MRRIALALASALLAGCAAHHRYEPTPLRPSLPPSAPPAAPAKPATPVTSAGPLTKANLEKYMDAQESELRALLRGKGTVARRGETLAVTISTDRLFDRMALSYSGREFVNGLARVVARYDHTILDLACYTDTTGGEAQNLAVSQKRAEAVAEVLWQNGVAASRLTAKGYGATNPKVSNGADPRNRRIELKIVPKPGAGS
ncbi:MAG: OmpA family protein [Alphaproteobacteria bacterium]|nr:OmpA family protein [Alphaproteobacteria bacterium]